MMKTTMVMAAFAAAFAAVISAQGEVDVAFVTRPFMPNGITTNKKGE